MIKQLALCVLQKGVGSMDYVHSMMIVMYDRDNDQVLPVQQNIFQEAPMKNKNQFLNGANVDAVWSYPKQLKTSAVSIRSVLQVHRDSENYALTQIFCYLAAEMLVISGMTHMIIVPGFLGSRLIDIIY